MGPWLNILDPGFNLHLNQNSVESIWAVEKPTSDGTVTSLEIYDQSGFCFCQFFGEKTRQERAAWLAAVSRQYSEFVGNSLIETVRAKKS